MDENDGSNDDDDAQEEGHDDTLARKKQQYIQGLIVQVQEKREEMTHCVRAENFAKAQSLKMDIGDLEDEIGDLEGDYDVLVRLTP